MAFNFLVVDDSSTIRKIIQRCISHTEIPVENIYEAGDGEEALGVLKDKSVDIVLTDINMPKMTGLELLSAMKADDRWKNLPVLLITTEGRADTVVDAVNRGASGYVKKPFTAVDIQAKLAPLLNISAS